ncbi:MAG: YajQ family cyclic di-GMP-binding protein [Gammaproteobacteria bacterium]
MPSFDIVSEINLHELTNAVDQANREINTRFDFKGSKAEFQLQKLDITLLATNEFQLKQMLDILNLKLTKRNIDVTCLDIKLPQISLNQAKQTITVKQGIDQEAAKKLVKAIKESSLKVQAAIQGEQIRVTGKKRDDLQQVMALLRAENWGLPLQYQNFRD